MEWFCNYEGGFCSRWYRSMEWGVEVKKIKKYILFIMALNMCFFAYESEKREAEAFAMSTAALILGGMAIVGAGGVILSQSGAGTLGEKVIQGFEAAGNSISNIFSYNAVEDRGKLIMSPLLKMFMNDAIGELKTASGSYVSSYQNNSSATKTGYYTAYLGSTVKASKGDVLSVSFDYSSSGAESGFVSVGYTSGGYDSEVAGVNTVKLINSPSGHFSGTVTVAKNIYDREIYLYGTPMKDGGSLTISNFTITNLNNVAKPEYKNYQQYAPISADSGQRLAQLNTSLIKDEYDVSASNVQENVSSVSQIEQAVAAVGDDVAGTNSLLTRLMSGLANIPSAIKSEMSNLWADAGAIWSGMNDTLINIKTDVGAKIGAMSDSMAGGIDNIRTDIGAMMENLRSGIDSLSTSAAANMAKWGQLALDGIDAGVGTITTGLTNIWERVADIPGAIAAIPGDIVTGLTDLAIPTPAQTAENEENMQTTKQLFLSKFDFITVPIEQIKSLYAQRKSLHDLTVDIMGQTVYVLPIQFAGVVSGFRPIASGAAVVGTIIFIYRRIQPEDVI